jgi:hypothetical protein
MTPHSLVGGYQRFGVTYRLLLQGEDGGDKTTIQIFTDVKTSNLIL